MRNSSVLTILQFPSMYAYSFPLYILLYYSFPFYQRARGDSIFKSQFLPNFRSKFCKNSEVIFLILMLFQFCRTSFPFTFFHFTISPLFISPFFQRTRGDSISQWDSSNLVCRWFCQKDRH